MKKSIVALLLVSAQSLCCSVLPSSPEGSLCWSVVPSSPEGKLGKKYSISAPQLRMVVNHWAEERSRRLTLSDRFRTSKETSFEREDIVPLQCAFPPPPIWTELNSPCHLIADLIAKMEPFVPGSVCKRSHHPLKGLGRLMETIAPQTAHDILSRFDDEGRLYNMRWAFQTLPYHHKDRKKLANSKHFYGLAWRLRQFLETCAKEPERIPFATQRLIHDTDAYIQLLRLKRRYNINKQQRHADSIQVLLKVGMCHARTDALEKFLLSSEHLDQAASNTKDVFTIITMVDDTFMVENSESSARTKIALSQEDLVHVLDSAFVSPIILEQKFLSWPMWSRFAQSYANRKSCITGGLHGNSFTREMFKLYNYTK